MAQAHKYSLEDLIDLINFNIVTHNMKAQKIKRPNHWIGLTVVLVITFGLLFLNVYLLK